MCAAYMPMASPATTANTTPPAALVAVAVAISVSAFSTSAVVSACNAVVRANEASAAARSAAISASVAVPAATVAAALASSSMGSLADAWCNTSDACAASTKESAVVLMILRNQPSRCPKMEMDPIMRPPPRPCNISCPIVATSDTTPPTPVFPCDPEAMCGPNPRAATAASASCAARVAAAISVAAVSSAIRAAARWRIKRRAMLDRVAASTSAANSASAICLADEAASALRWRNNRRAVFRRAASSTSTTRTASDLAADSSPDIMLVPFKVAILDLKASIAVICAFNLTIEAAALASTWRLRFLEKPSATASARATSRVKGVELPPIVTIKPGINLLFY